MNKEGLANAVMQAAGCETKKQSQEAVEAVFDTIAKAMSRGEEVSVSGFGVFRVTKRAARMGVNPKTGEKIHIEAANVPKFRPSKNLKDAIK